MLKMEYFYYMKEVCQTGSINRAAENLYISQPYLSQTLKKIEQQLGVPLLKRSNKGISLTDAGKEFLNISKEIIQLTQQAESLHNQYECRFPRAKHKQYAIIYNDERVSAIFKKRFPKRICGKSY